MVDSRIRTVWCEAAGPPAAVVRSGDLLSVEMSSFSEGYEFETMHELAVADIVTPLTGPIMVREARPGDLLRIDVLDLEFTRDFGCMLLMNGRGRFPNAVPDMLARALPIDDYYVRFSDRVTLPTRKMLGKLAVAPAAGRILSTEPGPHGGNMDNKDIGVGASVFLPVQVEGAYFGVGDGHAVQGDGECGISAVEVEMRGILRLSVNRGLNVGVPVIRSCGRITTMGAGTTLDEAADQALEAMSRLVMDRLSVSAAEAAMFLSAAADMHVAQAVNPLQGVKVSVDERYVWL